MGAGSDMLSRAEIIDYYRNKKTHPFRRVERSESPESRQSIERYDTNRRYRENIHKSIDVWRNSGDRAMIFRLFNRVDLYRKVDEQIYSDRSRSQSLLDNIRMIRQTYCPHMLDSVWPVRYDPNTFLCRSADSDEEIKIAIEHGYKFDRFDMTLSNITYYKLTKWLRNTPRSGLWTVYYDGGIATDDTKVACVIYLSHEDDIAELVRYRLLNAESFGDVT